MANPVVALKGIEDVMKMVDRLPKHVFENAKNAFRTATFGVQETVLKRLRGQPLQSRTGNLGRSIIPKVTGTTLAELDARVYSTAGYARIHELGGTINARDKYRWLPGGPYLNIPTDANKTPAGVMRMSSTEVFRGGGKVMMGPEGFGLYLNGDRMFRFAKRVVIPARLGMVAAGEAAVPTLLSDLNALLLADGDVK